MARVAKPPRVVGERTWASAGAGQGEQAAIATATTATCTTAEDQASATVREDLPWTHPMAVEADGVGM